jgi:hypothetical protein
VSAGDEPVEMRWIPGRGSCPGAVDLATVGPLGRIERAVTLPVALTLGGIIDVLCPSQPQLHATISQLPLSATDGREAT